MSFDKHANFSYSTVSTAPSPASSGTSLVVQAGDGAKFPAAPFNATVWPAGVQPTSDVAEIVRVTAKSTDTFTITRSQESSSARSIGVGDQIAATITAKLLTDIEASVVYATGVAATDTAAVQTAVQNGYLLVGSFSIDGSLGHTGYCIELAAGNTVNGIGRDFCTLTLANTTNKDVFRTVNYGTTSQRGITIQGVTIDGNRANQSTAGIGINLDALRVDCHDLYVHDCYTDGIYLKNTTAFGTNQPDNSSFINVKSCFNGNHGFNINSTDGHYVACDSGENSSSSSGTYDGFYMNSSGYNELTSCHGWGNSQRYAMNCNAGATLIANSQAEGAITANVRFGADYCAYVGGIVYAAGTQGLTGFVLDTSVKGTNINTCVLNCTSGGYKFSATTQIGNGLIAGAVHASSGSAVTYTGAGGLSGFLFQLNPSGGATSGIPATNGLVVTYGNAGGALPTADPHFAGELWSNSGTITVSGG